MALNDADHEMLMNHEDKLSDHERRINDLSQKMSDTMDRVEESNKYLREQNTNILNAVIKGNAISENHKHEVEMLTKQNLWKVVGIVLGSSSIVYMIIQQLFHVIH
ncbi:hypothetical protein [Secundilactobacillus kimchicus]|uniref:hypothetical protein n=1 Tax=Secundilactobacillus kimchicus TaxID=528209 RepID=UPI0024A8C2E5|nr:hypothetical protein [Secundilactobacillus kimchicus]